MRPLGHAANLEFNVGHLIAAHGDGRSAGARRPWWREDRAS